MEIKLDIFFLTATAEREEGNFVGFRLAVRLKNSPIRCFILTALPLGAYSSGSEAGLKRWFCAAIIHNLVMGFPIDLPSGKGMTINYMLCIIALSWLFSGAFFCFLWVDWNSGFEKTSLWKKGWLQKMWQKKTTKRGLCGSHKKRPCKPWGTNGGDFLWLVICPAELPIIYLQVKPDRFKYKKKTDR